jgi:glutamine synthetase
MSFIAQHGLWDPAQQDAAKAVQARIDAGGIETVRLSFPDLHGILRGKVLAADAVPAALRDGVAITSTLLLKDTAQRTVVPVFSAGAGLGLTALQGGADMIMAPDPTTFRTLPWASGAGWMLCDLYFNNGAKVPFSPRHLCRDLLGDLGALGYDFVSGLEIEFYLTRLLDPNLSLSDSGQPGTPPDVALLHHGHAYLSEQRFDQIEPIVEILRRDLTALGLGLQSMEVEFGPSQCEFVFRPEIGLKSADDMVLFRSATKQICRRHGYHASFMCRPRWPNVASSGWHLHQSLSSRADGSNAFAGADGEALSPVGRHFLAGLLEGAGAAAAFSTPTINGYRRYRQNSLAPDRAAWGLDNRGALLRVIRGVHPGATRIENRAGEPAANPYLYLASQIATGMAGMAAAIEPPPPEDAPYQAERPLLPKSLEEALAKLDQDSALRRSFGDRFIDYFILIKRHELSRFNAEVTEWEHREYFDLF